MPWVVDTCLLIDVNENDPAFGAASPALLKAKRADGLCISPVTLAELGPVFLGRMELAEQFLGTLGIQPFLFWSQADTLAAFHAWADFVQRKRVQHLRRRPVADSLIGAFALRFDGLLRRNTTDFRSILPTLNLLSP